MALGDCKRILVVDDHEDAADVLRDYLEALGGTIRVANDGATALRIADEFQPELALVDIGLPGMDGYQLAHELRDRPHDPHLRVVAITGFSRNPERERESSAVFDAHILKPVRAEKLTKMLRDLCDKECA